MHRTTGILPHMAVPGRIATCSDQRRRGESNRKTRHCAILKVTKQNAKARYLARARDSNDSREKFERRFVEYEVETVAVEEAYRQRGVLIDVSIQQSTCRE